MRFLVVAYGKEPLNRAELGDAAPRSHRYRERVMQEGKIVEHAHIAGQRGHFWVFHVTSVDELDSILAEDPMHPFMEPNPLILSLCSYERMAERERTLFGVADERQANMVALERQEQVPAGASSMRFLVIAYGHGLISREQLGDSPVRANRYREEMMRQGKISLHAHIAGKRGHMWVYHVSSVDELDKVMSDDPMAVAHQGNPLILPLCSYRRMDDREKEYYGKRA